MPAVQCYSSPHEQLREIGIKAKRQGVSFEEFWTRALRPGISPLITTETVRTVEPPSGAIVWPKDSADRANVMSAVTSSEEIWRRAYEDLPQTPGERAMEVLRDIAVEEASGSEDRGDVPLAA